jgi:DNA-binding transcriptional MerR regulator
MPDPSQEESSPHYRVGDVARLAGVSRQVVSTYCMYGLLGEAGRTDGGQRLFGDSAVRRIRLIRDLNRRYTLREIREIFIRDRI